MRLMGLITRKLTALKDASHVVTGDRITAAPRIYLSFRQAQYQFFRKFGCKPKNI
ncbi:hypothetical protein BYT27DRAFT_7187276 [Phlegmacium glaucopus]|nr:hypothetical protein BYT27DRAFT_7187276 [Phlegmacium glaucopus]